jgi:hypothetical protein
VEEPASAPATAACSFHIRIRAFAVFGDEAVDPRRDNGQQHRAELEYRIVERAFTRAAFKTTAVTNDVS